MTEAPSDELTLLAWEALEARDVHFRCWTPSQEDFPNAWRAAHVAWRGARALSFWRGPQTDAMVILTEGRPPARRLMSIDHRPCARQPVVKPCCGSFLRPGVPFQRVAALRCAGPIAGNGRFFAGWWPAEPGAIRLRLTRGGAETEIAAGPDGFILIDWDSAAPVDHFDAVEIDGAGWKPVAAPFLPFTGAHLFRSYARWREEDADFSDLNPDLWAYDLFSVDDDAWCDAVVAFIRHADPDRDERLLEQFGAHIYANGHPYYDRMERELNLGAIDPRALGRVLSMEKPEFMDEDLRIRHLRLAAHCG